MDISIVNVDSCDPICSPDFVCDWLRWTNPLKYKFPDGGIQTCVGAQVRCECTVAMSLASLFTYEHPSAVLLAFVFLGLIAILLLLRCMLLGHCGNRSFMDPQSSKQILRRTLSVAYPNSAFQYGIDGEGYLSSQTSSAQTKPSLTLNDLPPPYSTIIKMSEEPPPKYMECVKY